jgi:hypothetical protein
VSESADMSVAMVPHSDIGDNAAAGADDHTALELCVTFDVMHYLR